MSDGFISVERDNSRQLLVAFRLGAALAFVALAFSFWHFQIGQHTRFLEMAENNHQRILPLRAPRGVVFDRDGRVLVENRYSLDISLVRERVENLDESLSLLARVTNIPLEAVYDVIQQNTSVPDHRPLMIVRDASLSQVAAVTARRLELPGVVVEQVPTRYYPSHTMASHLFGYVGEATEAQLRGASDTRMRSGALVGQSGVEQRYNGFLMGDDGERHVVANSVGREIEIIDEVPPDSGRQIQLTLDYDLQRAAEDAFEAEGYAAGSAVVLDPQSGEVLSLVSLPAYDPNDFAVGIDSETWASLNSDSLRPLQNRALQGRYPPGSTFKVVMAAAALEEGVITPDFTVACRGGGTFFRRFFRCHSTHGTVSLYEALEKSCNTYFYTIGNMLDVDVINRWSEAFGLGVMSGIDLPHEVRGLIPSRAWKRERFGEPWYPGETISVAIGQGAVSVTPVSLAVMMATAANGGKRVTPHLLKAVRDGEGWREFEPPSVASMSIMEPETVDAIRRGLWMVVNHEGTGGRARIEGRDVIGKSGTAQVLSLSGRASAEDGDVDLRDHGWFVFAAPRDDPQIAGVVFAEHSDHGYLAAPIAKHIMETFFAKQDGQPLPVIPGSVDPTPAFAATEAGGQ
jgi:penicillin-binding protein 2